MIRSRLIKPFPTLSLSSPFPVNEVSSKITVKCHKVALMKKAVALKSEWFNGEILLFPISLPLVPYWYLYSWEMFKWHGFSTWAGPCWSQRLKWSRFNLQIFRVSLPHLLTRTYLPCLCKYSIISQFTQYILYYSSFLCAHIWWAGKQIFFLQWSTTEVGELFLKRAR